MKSPGDFHPEKWREPGDTNMGQAYARYKAAYDAWFKQASPAQIRADEKAAEQDPRPN